MVSAEQLFWRIPKSSEAVVRRFSVKKVFYEISQNSLENARARLYFLISLQALGLPA